MASTLKEVYWEQIIELIQTTPNDAELGEKLRKLYWDLPDRFKKSK